MQVARGEGVVTFQCGVGAPQAFGLVISVTCFENHGSALFVLLISCCYNLLEVIDQEVTRGVEPDEGLHRVRESAYCVRVEGVPGGL